MPIRERLTSGMSHIPEDRHKHGLVLDYSLEDNIVLQRYFEPQFTNKLGFLKRKEIRRYANRLIEQYDIRSGQGAITKARSMSGGNQQKVVFAKALLTEPSIWLCDEPTQAVDVATRQEIHRLLREEAKKGKAVLYVSSDLTELLEVADEVAVMAYGRVRKTFENKDLKPTDVLACCYEAEREENDR